MRRKRREAGGRGRSRRRKSGAEVFPVEETGSVAEERGARRQHVGRGGGETQARKQFLRLEATHPTGGTDERPKAGRAPRHSIMGRVPGMLDGSAEKKMGRNEPVGSKEIGHGSRGIPRVSGRP